MLLIEDKLAKIAKSLYEIGEQFGYDIENDTFWCDCEDMLYTKAVTEEGGRVYYGASKAVIVFPELDHVLKIPFSGYYEPRDPEWDEENEEYNYDNCNNDEWYWFEGAGNDIDETDYCATEMEMWKEIEDAGLGFLFAKTQVLDDKTAGRPIYIQEKVYPLWGEHDKTEISEDSAKKAKESRKFFHQHFAELIIEWYGEEVLEKLYKLFRESNSDLGSDLHSDNIGTRRDGSPVIYDYAGYNS